MAQASEQRTSQRRLAVSGAEVILLTLLVALGISLCVWVERVFTSVYSEPNEQQFLSDRGINTKEEELVRLETQRKDVESQIAAVDLEQLRYKAALVSLKTLHPGIEVAQQGAATSISPEAVKSYESAKSQEIAAGELVKLLRARRDSLKGEKDRIASELEPAKQAAINDFQREKSTYVLRRTAAASLFPLLIVAIALFIMGRVLNHVAARKVWIAHGCFPFLVVVYALLILLAYQTFQVAGALSLVLILFLFVLWKMNWSPKSDKAAATENTNAGVVVDGTGTE